MHTCPQATFFPGPSFLCLFSLPCPPVLCAHVRNSTVRYSLANVRRDFPTSKRSPVCRAQRLLFVRLIIFFFWRWQNSLIKTPLASGGWILTSSSDLTQRTNITFGLQKICRAAPRGTAAALSPHDSGRNYWKFANSVQLTCDKNKQMLAGPPR